VKQAVRYAWVAVMLLACSSKSEGQKRREEAERRDRIERDKVAPPPDTSWYWTAGDDFCERACSAADKRFGEGMDGAPPPGKDVAYAAVCRELCKGLDKACAEARRKGEEAFGPCLGTFAASAPGYDFLCSWIAFPPGVHDECELAVARKTGGAVHCMRMIDAGRQKACRAEVAKKKAGAP
jgi:hypothetical protein